MGGENDRRPGPAQIENRGAQDLEIDGIEAGKGLIQDQQRRVGKDR